MPESQEPPKGTDETYQQACLEGRLLLSDSRIHFAGSRTWGNRYPHPHRWTLSYVIRPRNSQLSPKSSRTEKLKQLGEGESIAGHIVGYQRKGG